MADDRISTARARVEKPPRPGRKRRSSLVLNPRITSVIHVSVRPCRSARLSTDSNDNKEENIKSTTTQDSIIRSTSAVSVTRVRRPSSQRRQNSWKSFNNSSSDVTDSTTKRHRLRTVKVVHQQVMKSSSTAKSDDVLHSVTDNKSVSTNDPHRKKSLGTIDDLTNPIHKHHHSTKNFYKKCFRCSRLRVLVLFCSLLILGIIIAIILLTKSKTKDNKFPTVAFLRWNTTGITLFGTTSIRGNTSNQFNSPFGLALDSFNDLYVADRYNHRIQKCRFADLTCTTIAGNANAVRGTNTSELNGPTYLYIDSNNNLYIADSDNYRVQFWNYGASYGKTIAGITGSPGSALNQFRIPYGIALDSSSNTMFVADYNNYRVMKYISGASSGTIIAGGNGLGMNNTQLNLPAGIYFESFTNTLLISNFGSNNIVRWILGDNKWTIVAGATTGLNGNTSTFLYHPTSVTLDPMGNIYVADMFNHRIEMYLVGQSSGTTIAGISGSMGTNSTMFSYPVSMVLDNQLNLYVTDSFNQRIQKFSRY